MEIDILRILNVFVRRWRIIVTVGVLAVIAASIYAMLFPSPYRATATIAIIKTRTDVAFDPRFKTVSDNSTAASSVAQGTTDARRNALLGLVNNAAIANPVITQLGDKLSLAEHNPGELLRKVDGSLVQRGDLIQIGVVDRNPEMAANIANLWAREYERYINNIYGGAPTEYSTEVKSESERVRQEYLKAQRALEEFTATSQVESLTRQVNAKKQLLDLLEAGQRTATSTVISSEITSETQVISEYLNAQASNRLIGFRKEQEGLRNRIAAQIDAQNNAQIAVFNQQVQANLQTLSNYYETRLRVKRLINDARSMREQVSVGGVSAAASNRVALLLLKAQAFSLSAPLPSQLQVQVGAEGSATPDDQAQIADLDALIDALQKRGIELDTSITDLSKQLISGEGYAFITSTLPISNTLSQAIAYEYPELFNLNQTAKLTDSVSQDTPLNKAVQNKIDQVLQLNQSGSLGGSPSASQDISQQLQDVTAEIRGLQAQLEHEQARTQQLTQQRDLTWETYNTLSRKEAEVGISSAITGSEVRFAAPAVPPTQRQASRLASRTVLGLIGLALGALLALAIDYFSDETEQQVKRGKAPLPWTRVFQWIMTPTAGLPQRKLRTEGG